LLVASTSLAIWWARKSENPGLVDLQVPVAEDEKGEVHIGADRG